MKLNYKVHKTLHEPAMVQTTENMTIGLYYLNDTQFFSHYVNRGQYAIWTSDGKEYKLLIEKSYYEEFKEIFTPEMNEIWIDYFKDVMGKRTFLTRVIWYPVVALVAVLTILMLIFSSLSTTSEAMLDFIESAKTPFLIGALVLLIGSNIVNASLFKKYATNRQLEHFQAIEQHMGAERQEELANQQETFHNRFMKQFQTGEPYVAETPAEEVTEAPLVEAAVVADVVAEEVTEEPVVEEVIEEPVVEEEQAVEEIVEEAADEEPVVEDEPVEEPAEQLEVLNKLKVAELKEFAKNRGVANFNSMNKTELVEALPSSLEEFRVPELKELAKALGLSNYSAMNKTELIDLINNGPQE